jgi:general secretion pathway protein C
MAAMRCTRVALERAQAGRAVRGAFGEGPGFRRSAPWLVACALALAITAELVAGALTWLRPRPSAHANVARLAQVAAPPDVTQALVDAHLFGQAAIAPVEGAEVTGALELTAVFALADPRTGYAVIRTDGRQEHVYGAGETVAASLIVSEVFPDRVVIDRAGVTETLSLPRTSAVSRLATARLGHALPQVDTLLASAVRLPDKTTNGWTRGLEVRGPVGRVLQVSPWTTDGGHYLLGYTVSAGRDHSPLPGVAPGTIIREINGVRLIDGEVAQRMFDSLAAGGVAVLNVVQGETTRNITVDASALPALIAVAPKPRFGS